MVSVPELGDSGEYVVTVALGWPRKVWSRSPRSFGTEQLQKLEALGWTQSDWMTTSPALDRWGNVANVNSTHPHTWALWRIPEIPGSGEDVEKRGGVLKLWAEESPKNIIYCCDCDTIFLPKQRWIGKQEQHIRTRNCEAVMHTTCPLSQVMEHQMVDDCKMEVNIICVYSPWVGVTC